MLISKNKNYLVIYYLLTQSKLILLILKENMSNDEIENVVQQNCHLIQEYLIEVASKQFRAPVYNLQLTATQTKQRFGASGQLLISDIYYDTEYGENSTNIAFKYFNEEAGALVELKNSIELDFRFKSHPHFATPKLIFASTKDPVLLIYEGINAINYDEIEVTNKASHAGELLAAIHRGNPKPVNKDIYKGLARMIGKYIEATGLEKKISDGLGRIFNKMENAMSGCDPFSDFHQSNVMLSTQDDLINKVYIIDPEFMQKGRFDRLEDVGTFFAFQLLNEYKETKSIKNGLREVNEFLKAYQRLNLIQQGLTWKQMYPNGCPLSFFVAQWAIMDSLDKSMRLQKVITDPELLLQIKFADYILSTDPFKFPE